MRRSKANYYRIMVNPLGLSSRAFWRMAFASDLFLESLGIVKENWFWRLGNS
jgi:hypothetical protein